MIKTDQSLEERKQYDEHSDFEKDFEKHLISFNSNPVDIWCLGNACCFIDGHENYSCKKASPNKRIDGAVVFIILYATLMKFNTEYQSYVK